MATQSAIITLQASQVTAITDVTTTRQTTYSLGDFNGVSIVISFTAGGTATGTVQIYIQDSADGGTTWSDLCSSNTFALGAAASKQTFWLSFGASTGGTQGAAPSTEAMAAGTARNGARGDRIRIREKVSSTSGSPVGATYNIVGYFHAGPLS